MDYLWSVCLYVFVNGGLAMVSVLIRVCNGGLAMISVLIRVC